jgi:uncharacterized protein YqeY
MYSENLDKKIAECLKSGQSVELSVWRAIKAEFLNFKTAKAGNVLTDDVELKLINSIAAKRRDAAAMYESAGRNDLAEKELQELEVLVLLLPKEPTEEEITNIVVTYINNYRGTNGENPSMKNMKECLSMVKTSFPTVNGGIVSKIFQKSL